VASVQVKKSKLRGALKNEYVKTAILIVIIVGSVLSFWLGIRVVFRTEYPFMAVASPSMVPTLNTGDLIVVQGYVDTSTIYAAAKPYGDIVVFWHWSPGRGLEHWVHRSIGEKMVNGKRYLETRGDANLYSSDVHWNITTQRETDKLPGLPEEYVIGKVVASAPVLGQIALFMQTLEGRIIIIALVIVLLIAEFIPFPKKDKVKAPEQEQSSVSFFL